MITKLNLNKFINKLEEISLMLILVFFSYFIPKDKNIILFGSGDGNLFNGNPKYLYLYLINNNIKNFKPIWVTNNKEVFLNLNNKNMRVEIKKTFKGIWSILRAKYIVIDHIITDVGFMGMIFGRFNKIQTWHGTPFKKICLDEKNKLPTYNNGFFYCFLKKEFKSYKMIVSSSKEVSKKLSSAFLSKNIFVTGYPRNDLFFNKKFIFKDYQNKFKLFKYKKIILYAPTFRDNYLNVTPFSNYFLNKLNEYLKINNFLFLIKKHPSEKKINIPSRLSNILDISKKLEDIQEILVHTNLLITDYSSVSFDFAIINRPIIFYSYDYSSYLEKCRDVYYDYYKTMPGPFADNEEDLLKLIKTADNWSLRKDYKLKYASFRDKFNKYKDGNSSKRLINLLLKRK